MNRDEKVNLVSELNDSFSRANFTIVADYCGLNVSEIQQIRVELRSCDSEIRIAKNTLLRRAAEETANAVLNDDFVGTTAVVMSYADPVAPAKAIAKFADDFEKFKIRSAVLDGEKISVEELVALSKTSTSTESESNAAIARASSMARVSAIRSAGSTRSVQTG